MNSYLKGKGWGMGKKKGNAVNNIVISLNSDMITRISRVVLLYGIKMLNHYTVYLKLI